MPKSASELSNEKVIEYFNRPDLDNQQVVDKLDTTWEALMTKVRVNATLRNALTMDRRGGVNGTYVPTAAQVTAAEIDGVAAAANVSLAPADGDGVALSFQAVIMGEVYDVPGPTRGQAREQIRAILAQVKMKKIIVMNEAGEVIDNFESIRPGQRVTVSKLSTAASAFVL
jgi:hypothetical protein